MATQLVVFQEKYGDRHFDASTPALMAVACAKILKERNAEGCWYTREYTADGPALSAAQREVAALSAEQVAALPTEALRDQVQMTKAQVAHKIKRWNAGKIGEDRWFAKLDLIVSKTQEEIAALVEAQDGTWVARHGYTLPEQMIQSRCGGEYQGYDTMYLEGAFAEG